MSPRTLVISDLHIGARDHWSVVERPEVLEILLDEIGRCERLVLLGDLIELLEAEALHTFEVAAPILRAIGARVGANGSIVYVPGNHDRALIRGWIRAQGTRLTPEALVPPDASSLLARVIAQLAPAPVEIRYPAVWLNDRVWAHHGHYLNRYLVPDQAYGLMRRGRERPELGRLRPIDFEPRRDRDVMRSLVRYLPTPAAVGVEDVEELARAATMPAGIGGPTDGFEEPPIEMRKGWASRLHDRILHPNLSPLISYLLGLQVRRHSLPAVARVAHDLGVQPEFLLFGHVHRRGPIAGDDLREWNESEPGYGDTPPELTDAAASPRILNTGSWRWEPVLVQKATAPHPYWPGGAIVIDDSGEPRSIGLLDSLTRAELTGENG